MLQVYFTRFSGILFLVALGSSCEPFSSGGKRWGIDRARYDAADPAKTSLVVSLYDQRVWLLDGEGKVVLLSEVSTGVPGHETPVGEFRVLERTREKRSNRYGRYVNAQTGRVVVAKSWLHSGEPPEGTVFEGIEMPYWMRLTWWGVGMHVGDFPSHTRCSFGCVRVYEKAQPLIFAKTVLGTRVSVYQKSMAREVAKHH